MATTSPSTKDRGSAASRVCRLIGKFFNIQDDGADGRYASFTHESSLGDAKPRPSALGTNKLLVDRYPLGYPSLAAFQNSDPNFAVYRRFGLLRKRLIVHRQAQLRELQLQLNMLDAIDHMSDCDLLSSINYEQKNGSSERPELLNKIQVCLKDYGDPSRTLCSVLSLSQSSIM